MILKSGPELEVTDGKKHEKNPNHFRENVEFTSLQTGQSQTALPNPVSDQTYMYTYSQSSSNEIL